MTDPVPHPEQTAATADTAAAAVSAAPAAAAPLTPPPALSAAAAQGAEVSAAAPAPGEGGAAMAAVAPPAGSGKRRGGRNRRKGAGGGAADAAEGQPHPAQEPSPTQSQQAEAGARAPRGPRPVPPALEKLAELYPQLFGAVFRPLKRGIFQDLVAAHPEEFEREALKVALGIHTRSTRYLQSVAAGQQRHDLQGQPVEAMAPEHVHQALVEVHRRRSGRGRPSAQGNPEEPLLKLRARIVANIEASGLSREAYAERVRSRDEAANALLDDALADMAAKTAREEALVRAFEASGKTVEAFADMYGMDPRSVSRSLHGARARAAAEAAGAAAEAATADAAALAPPHPPRKEDRGSAAGAAVAIAAPASALAQPRRRPWCLRTRMTMTPSAPLWMLDMQAPLPSARQRRAPR